MIQTCCDVHRSLVEMLCVLYGLNFWHVQQACNQNRRPSQKIFSFIPFHVWHYLKLKVYQHCALDLDIDQHLHVHATIESDETMVSCV